MWGNDTTDESNQAIKRTKKVVYGVTEHTEKQLQKNFVSGKSIAIDESTVGFKGKIIFKIHYPEKPTKRGIRIFVLAESDTGYVHSIIPNCGKFTGNVRNLPYFEEPLALL
jgi:hypothetical protein